jgi:hypothetical protein
MGNENNGETKQDAESHILLTESYTELLCNLDKTECYKKIDKKERDIIREIFITFSSCLLENFRSLIFIFSFINNSSTVDPELLEELKYSSELVLWLKEYKRKIQNFRTRLDNYRNSILEVLGSQPEIPKKLEKKEYREFASIIKSDPHELIKMFTADTGLEEAEKTWNMASMMREMAKILRFEK